VRPFERLRYLARSFGDDEEVLLEESADCLAGFADDPMGVVIACRRLLAYHPRVPTLWWLCAQVLSAPDPAEGAWSAWREWRSDPTPGRLAGALPFPLEEPVAVIGWPPVLRDGLAERIDLELLALRNPYGSDGLSRRLRTSVQQVRVIDETELPALVPAYVIVTPVATGGDTILVEPGTAELVAAARAEGAAAWLVVPRGVALPARMLEALRQAAATDPAAVPMPGADEWWHDDSDFAVEEWSGPAFDLVVGPDGTTDQRALGHRADCAPAPELLRLG
jgi:hypothetical protein